MRHNNRDTYALAVKDGKTLLFRHEAKTRAETQHYIGHYLMLWAERKQPLTHFILYSPADTGEPPLSIFINAFQDEPTP